MQTHPRADITPKPAEFNAVPPTRILTVPELLLAALSMCALVITVVAVEDPLTRTGGVLVITAVVAAFVARQVDAARRRH